MSSTEYRSGRRRRTPGGFAVHSVFLMGHCCGRRGDGERGRKEGGRWWWLRFVAGHPTSLLSLSSLLSPVSLSLCFESSRAQRKSKRVSRWWQRGKKAPKEVQAPCGRGRSERKRERVAHTHTHTHARSISDEPMFLLSVPRWMNSNRETPSLSIYLSLHGVHSGQQQQPVPPSPPFIPPDHQTAAFLLLPPLPHSPLPRALSLHWPS